MLMTRLMVRLLIINFCCDLVQGAFRDVTSVTRKTVQERDTVTLQCNPPKSVPPAVISWGIHDEVNAIDPIHLTKRIQIDGEGEVEGSAVGVEG